MILQQKGYNTDTAEIGQEAIQKSKAKFFNLAPLDIKLPDIDGTKLLTMMHDNLPKMIAGAKVSSSIVEWIVVKLLSSSCHVHVSVIFKCLYFLECASVWCVLGVTCFT